MSFLYPRRISVTRPNPAAVAGDGGYAGLDRAQETLIASNVPANIQTTASGGQAEAKVPSDVWGRATPWRVFIPRGALANGTVKLRDIVTDDLGQRYQVGAPYWNSLGYALRALMLEA